MGLLVVIAVAALGAPWDGSARPEKIRPGHVYYSAELAEPTHGGRVRALGPEKNYEEVYQLYRYHEVVYDAGERVVQYREVVRGEVVRSEEYLYDASGVLTWRRVARPGKEDEVTVVETADSQPAPEPRSR